jgi:hypothetical protein
MRSKGALRRLAAVAVIGLIAATGCSTSKTAAQQPSSSPPASSSAPAVVVQPVDLSGLDQSLSQIDQQTSGANAGINSTSEGDVQTQ